MHDWPEGVGRRLYPTLDSTNTEAVRLAHTGEGGPLWVQALEQTGGRGRRGRVWHGGAGNLFASLLMRPAGDPAHAALRSFSAALALRAALVETTGRSDLFTLKWPNDVLGNGRKLAGILLEGGAGYLVVGIGVNLATTPPQEALETGAVPPVSLKSLTGLAPDPQEFLPALARAFARLETEFAAYGFAPIRQEWLHHAARLGETVTARLPNREVTGLFETIDDTGALVLATAKGHITLPAAEIFFEE